MPLPRFWADKNVPVTVAVYDSSAPLASPNAGPTIVCPELLIRSRYGDCNVPWPLGLPSSWNS